MIIDGKNKQAVDTNDDTEKTEIVEIVDDDVDIENNILHLEKDIDTTSAMVVVDDNAAAIPTLFDIFIHFSGSLSFVVGSAGYISSTYYENRLPYVCYGSFFMSYGCVMYSVPLFMKFRNRSSNNSCCPWGIEDLGAFLCYCFFIIGCILYILASYSNKETGLKYYPVIEHMFVYGSFSLTIEPFYQVILFFTRGGNCRSRIGASKLWSISCGFYPHPDAALAGVYFAEIGSLLCLARSFLMVNKRRVGLKAMQKDSRRCSEVSMDLCDLQDWLDEEGEDDDNNNSRIDGSLLCLARSFLMVNKRRVGLKAMQKDSRRCSEVSMDLCDLQDWLDEEGEEDDNNNSRIASGSMYNMMTTNYNNYSYSTVTDHNQNQLDSVQESNR
ncbi:hypothetical protein FRACYDRAFT_250997 [Fragilariopsis cylindrus CCMP1102]|uniref:Uncharacterized protein n=1 Tax=Fragilariopsis cylindrus CCMP1102 TaxID=635003 RepID=A0A1E7ENY0_9STRA|nr:hypothetical protein FRACYDRAFT_250997 [Fragilariopsis cylindrus CCMP1102]|eukprot:OEU07575.1 hypothetical protein FRACYDRAFT_250997 [Fragilariopsis cylindrus CCMP1102]